MRYQSSRFIRWPFSLICLLFCLQSTSLASPPASIDGAVFAAAMQQQQINENQKKIDRHISDLRRQLDLAKSRIGIDPAGCTDLDCQLPEIATLIARLTAAEAALIEVNRANAKELTSLIGWKDKEINNLQSGSRAQGEAAWVARLFGAEFRGGIDYQQAVIQSQASMMAVSAAANLDFAGLLKQKGILDSGTSDVIESKVASALESLFKSRVGNDKRGDMNIVKGELLKQLSGPLASLVADSLNNAVVPAGERDTVQKALASASSTMSAAVTESIVDKAFVHFDQVRRIKGKTLAQMSKADLRAALNHGLKHGFKLSSADAANIVGKTLLAVGNVLAEHSQQRELDRLKALKMQLSVADRERLRLIRAWRSIMTLNRTLKGAIDDIQTSRDNYDIVATACRESSAMVPACAEVLSAELAAQEVTFEQKMVPLDARLKQAKSTYETRLTNYKARTDKRTKLDTEIEEIRRQLQAARTRNESTTSLSRRFDDLNDDLAAFSMEPEASRLSLAKADLDRVWTERKHAAERHRLSMRFALQDARKKMYDCLKLPAPVTPPRADQGEGENAESNFDVTPLYTGVIALQHELIRALKAARINATGGDKCPKTAQPDRAISAPPPLPSPNLQEKPVAMSVDPLYAGLYLTPGGEMMVRVHVNGTKMHGEVAEVCQAMVKSGGSDYRVGDTYIEGQGITYDRVAGHFHMQLTSWYSGTQAETPACVQKNWRQKPEALFVIKEHHGGVYIHARYSYNIAKHNCETMTHEVDAPILNRPKRSSPSQTMKDLFDQECKAFEIRNQGFVRPKAPVMPTIDMMDMMKAPFEPEPLLKPEPLPPIPE